MRVQRELQGLPRNYARFQQYLGTMLNQDGLELPPLGIMNPMGKDHVTALLDALLALDADGVGARAAADASAALPDVPGAFKIALVVADDLMGGWTNRYDYEFTFRFGSAHRPLERDPDSPSGFRLPRWLKHFWLTALLDRPYHLERQEVRVDSWERFMNLDFPDETVVSAKDSRPCRPRLAAEPLSATRGRVAWLDLA